MTEGQGQDDSERADRQRAFSRRELLRAGMVIPVALSLPAVAAACGSSSGPSNGHGDHTDTGDSTRTDSGGTDSGHNDSVHTDTGHTDSVHTDSGHTDSGHTDSGHTDSGHTDSGHSDTAHADSKHTDSPHSDTAHVDTPHADTAGKPRTIHDDAGGPHGDSTQHGTITFNPPHNDFNAFTDHNDTGFHADSTVNVPGSHEDTAHVDTAHVDSPHADTPHVDSGK